MREIKFRAWHKHEERMLKWNKELKGVIAGGVKTISSFNTDNGWMDTYSYKEVELMQYTGLKDKNGKEIYEGDVVQFDDYDITFGLIKWNEKHGRFEVEEYEPYTSTYFETEQFEEWTTIEHFEIIGNAYENPELLGGI